MRQDFVQLRLSHGLHLRVFFFREHLLRRFDGGDEFIEVLDDLGNLAQTSMLLLITQQFLCIGNDISVSQQAFEFFVTLQLRLENRKLGHETPQLKNRDQ